MGLIKEDIVDRIISAARIEDVVKKSGVTLKKAGSSLQGCCPFHNDKTPSFHVTIVRNMYKCFGCGVAGGPVNFVMEREGKTYPEALKWLAEFYNIEIEYDDDKIGSLEKREARERYFTTSAAASEKYTSILLSLKEDHEVIKYLTDRGIDREVILDWRLGWAPDAWDTLTSYLQQQGHHDDAIDLSLVKKREKKDGYFDFFRNRIIFPILDKSGRPISFGGRLIADDPEKKQPKYLNGPETTLYQKSFALYGLSHAIQELRRTIFAYLVEGYVDVITMHRFDLVNTVAACGTSITDEQLSELKRHCEELALLMDADAAGLKSFKRTLPMALKQGFRTWVVPLPEKDDPDSFCIAKGKEAKAAIEELKTDALLWLATFEVKMTGGDPHKLNAVINEIAEIINQIPQPVIKQWYLDNFKDTGIKNKDLREAIKAIEARERKKMIKLSARNPNEGYELPMEVLKTDGSFEKYQGDILNYGLFFHRNRLYALRNDIFFEKVANFSIEIIQHMEDEKFPMKLIKITNEHGKARTFDKASKTFISIMAFKEMLSDFGNFKFDGNISDFDRLVSKLFDEMGDGRMITVLGQQPEGFFVFSNAAILGTEIIELDQYGCFEHAESSYYVPAGNIIYKHNNAKFTNEKRAILLNSKVTLKEYMHRMYQVHREHGITGILFSVATMFSDIIYERLGFFPIMFLYGEASTGKDNLIEACQAFFGRPQEALLLSSKSNTDKARIRVLAQFRNMIANFREYKVDDVIDEMLKGIWDRSGYKRGNIDSAFGTDTVPIDCSVMVSSNDYPVNDALITRLIAEEFMKNDFSEEEKTKYNELKEVILDGVSSITADILPLRGDVKQYFRKVFNEVATELKTHLGNIMVVDRMIQNVAVLGAIYKITEAKIPYPFSFEKWIEHANNSMAKQAQKRETGGEIQRFWDCFLMAVREKQDPIIEGREFKIEHDVLTINLAHVFPAYVRYYFQVYREKGASKGILMDKLKKSNGFKEVSSSTRFGYTKSSGYVFDLTKLHIKDSLLEVIDWKSRDREKQGWPSNNTPETPVAASSENDGQIPF